MRKSVITTMATVILVGGQFMLGTVYADTGTQTSVTSGQDVTSTDPATSQMGDDSQVLRPGADPNNPNDYAYLPPNMAIPVPGPRTEYPQVPSTSSTGSTGGGTVAVTNQIMSASNISSTPPSQATSGTLPDIAIGKPYTMGVQWPDATFEKSEVAYSNTGQLTDGQYASLSFSDKGWVGVLRQGGHSVVVNLGSSQQVTRVSLDFLQNLGAGIDFPDSVTYYASNDGSTWQKIGTAWSGQGGGDYTPQTQPYTVDTKVNAQYIRAQFDDKVFSFMDEFSVFGVPQQNQGSVQQSSTGGNSQGGNDSYPRLNGVGTAFGLTLPSPTLSNIMGNDFLVDPDSPGLPNLLQAVSTFQSPTGPFGPQGPSTAQSLLGLAALGLAQGTTELNAALTDPRNQSGYLTTSEPGTDGIKNMEIVYTGSNGSEGEWSESDFLPMIAQENANDTPTGWLFDGTLFGDYSSNTPETANGWTSWLTDLFTPNVELSALDQAVGSVKQQLNDPNFKEKVVITIPGLNDNPSSFGVVDASGQSLDLNPADVGQVQATINKAKVIQWYMQQVLNQWNSAKFSNLQLAGFYWEPEGMAPTQPLDAELIQTTAAMVHRDNLKFYWIPTYGAPGVSDWEQLGYDDVTSQAGVAFNFSIDPAARLQSVANMAQYYHMGLEMEQPYNTTSANPAVAENAQNKFFDYFTGGYLYGYEGNVMKTWYLNSKGLLPAYQSTNPIYRQMYDNTVAFVNNEWTQTGFH